MTIGWRQNGAGHLSGVGESTGLVFEIKTAKPQALDGETIHYLGAMKAGTPRRWMGRPVLRAPRRVSQPMARR